MFRPEIHFDHLHHRQWIGKDLKDLDKEMNELRVKVRDATNYRWDNSHFFIDSYIAHKTALEVLFSPSSITFWNAVNGCAISGFTEFGKEEAKQVSEWIKNITEGLTQCNECKKWVKEYTHYGFAGAVCEDCYDPNRHLPPDTSGD